MRLQKYLAESGVSSRRKAEEHIAQGLVKVNGEIITTLGYKVNPATDIVLFMDQKIEPVQNHSYILLNKPAGYLSTCSDTHNRQTILDLLPNNKRLFPVGRLDKDTEGLLIITDDGDFAYKLTHPKHKIEKEYLVTCNGKLDEATKTKLEKGVVIENKKTALAQIDIKKRDQNSTTLHITIHEGRKRQIRNMFEIVGHKVHYLKRIRIGQLTLDSLSTGSYRYLNDQELALLC